MAPEILRGSSVKMKDIDKCDVWSVGVTIYELACGQLPFGMSKKDLSEQRIMERIEQEGQQFEIRIPAHPLLEKLVRQMLVAEPSARISFKKANQLMQEEGK